MSTFFTIDRSKCIGGGQCVVSAETVFGQSVDDGLITVLDESVSNSDKDAVREAANLCPAGVIIVHE